MQTAQEKMLLVLPPSPWITHTSPVLCGSFVEHSNFFKLFEKMAMGLQPLHSGDHED